MRISRVRIENFRNFKACEVFLGSHAVIVGENRVGKSNFVYALRLVLDPRLSDADRHLRLEDFWDGLPRPLKAGDQIRLSLDLTDFEANEDHLAVLAPHLVGTSPLTARLTYVFRPLPTLAAAPGKESDYEFITFGGDREDNPIGYEVRHALPLTILPALRDAEDDLRNWRRSPLAPLIRSVDASIDRTDLEKTAAGITAATSALSNLDPVKMLAQEIRDRLAKMAGPSQFPDTSLGVSPADPTRLLRSLRLFIDAGVRTISEASLGSANLIYLALLSLEMERQLQAGDRSHNFLAIEEPEAHLHPHLQRTVFRDFLRERGAPTDGTAPARTILLTTHSPHIVSVAPLHSLVGLRSSAGQTIAVSTAQLKFDSRTTADLERYLDVTRGEIVFARAVILVEGMAEKYLVPAFARLGGIDLDHLGVTVASVEGTHFGVYLHLLGTNGLGVPTAVLTDRDPRPQGKGPLGEERVAKLVADLVSATELNGLDMAAIIKLGTEKGLFLNDDTLECDIFRCGRQQEICSALEDLATTQPAADRARKWRATPATWDRDEYLRDVTAIGKGRFAQHLAGLLGAGPCPSYIQSALEFVKARVQ